MSYVDLINIDRVVRDWLRNLYWTKNHRRHLLKSESRRKSTKDHIRLYQRRMTNIGLESTKLEHFIVIAIVLTRQRSQSIGTIHSLVITETADSHRWSWRFWKKWIRSTFSQSKLKCIVNTCIWHPQTETSALVGSLVPNGKWPQWQNGAVSEAIEKGHWLILERLNPVLEQTPQWIPLENNQTKLMIVSPNFRLIDTSVVQSIFDSSISRFRFDTERNIHQSIQIVFSNQRSLVDQLSWQNASLFVGSTVYFNWNIRNIFKAFRFRSIHPRYCSRHSN